jgi:hypothetical protein
MTMLGHSAHPCRRGIRTGCGSTVRQLAALNAKDAGDMRDGYRTELFNSRGVHGFSAGREERELARKYRDSG